MSADVGAVTVMGGDQGEVTQPIDLPHPPSSLPHPPPDKPASQLHLDLNSINNDPSNDDTDGGNGDIRGQDKEEGQSPGSRSDLSSVQSEASPNALGPTDQEVLAKMEAANR